jgi:hypothetical protein
MWLLISDSSSLESNNRHEIREAYDVTSLDGFFPDEDAPEFRRSVVAIIPPLRQLTHRLLKCFAIALGKFLVLCLAF